MKKSTKVFFTYWIILNISFIILASLVIILILILK